MLGIRRFDLLENDQRLLIEVDGPLHLPKVCIRNAQSAKPYTFIAAVADLTGNGQPLIVVRDGFVRVTLDGVGAAPIVVGDGILRVKSNGFVIVSNGLVQVAQFDVGKAPVCVGRSLLRIKCNRSV